jgi:hypothetical protein
MERHNQMAHILIDRRWQPNVLYYEVVGKLTVILISDHYLVVAKVKEMLVVSTLAAQTFDVERFNLRS